MTISENELPNHRKGFADKLDWCTKTLVRRIRHILIEHNAEKLRVWSPKLSRAIADELGIEVI
ncbi:MAG: hypothetical protein V4543_08470 [Bacteroidota bacterium]